MALGLPAGPPFVHSALTFPSTLAGAILTPQELPDRPEPRARGHSGVRVQRAPRRAPDADRSHGNASAGGGCGKGQGQKKRAGEGRGATVIGGSKEGAQLKIATYSSVPQLCNTADR